MKSYITPNDWRKIEDVLMHANVGYRVTFDNHCGDVEMLVDINTISCIRFEREENNTNGDDTQEG